MTATVALASIYVRISVRYASGNFVSRYMLHNFPFVHDFSRAITSEPLKSENQTLVANSTTFVDILQGLVILDCVAREHGWLLVLHDTAKGVACETRSEPPPSLASLAVGLTPRAKKKMCLLTLLDVRNAISPCLHFCCTNNRIISFLREQMN